MQRLVYAPKVHAFVRTEKEGITDISDYIVSGNVHRVQNAVSTAQLQIRNPGKVFTQPGVPFFHPMDPITIWLTRLKDRPVQVFTGYVDTSPYLQLFPGTVTLTASCTLKRLMHTYWDPSLPYVFDGFLREYGWNVDPKTGAMFNQKFYTNQQTVKDNQQSLNDGSFGALLLGTLKEVGHWSSDSIYIEKLPGSIVQKVTEVYNKIASDNQGVQEDLQGLFQNLMGSNSHGDGGGPLAPDNQGYSGSLTAGQHTFAEKLGSLSGLNTRVISAWMLAEESGDAAKGREKAGNHNWLNIGPGRTYSTAEEGAKATFKVLQQSNMSAILDAARSQDPQKEIDAIVASPWDQAHYGGGDILRRLYSEQSNDTPATPKKKAKGRSTTPTKETTPADGSAPQATKDTTPAHAAKAGGAAPDAHDALKKGDWTLAPGANRQGVNMRDPIKQFLSVLAGQTSESIVVGTGTNHNQYTTDGNQSDHWTGDAADIQVGGDARSDSAAGRMGDNIAAAALKVLGKSDAEAHRIAQSGALNFTQNYDWYGHRIQIGWRTLNGGNHFNHVHVGVAFAGSKIPDTIPKDGSGSSDGSSGGGSGGSNSSTSGDSTTASAFAAYLNLPGVFDVAESIALRGQKSMLNDQPLFPFVQQLCQGSLRNFMSMPNGNFYGFFPDYFGGFTNPDPYWLINDIEVLDGGIDLTDDYLATHVYIVGDTNFDGQINIWDRLQSAGVMDLESAFRGGFLKLGDAPSGSSDGDKTKSPAQLDRANTIKFLKKYGARPYKEELPMIRSPFFEAFLSYQRFMQLWAKQFATTFQFTFMPELFPGGIVGLADHGIQCYIEEVIHSFDYESGFSTQAVLSAPAAMKTSQTAVSDGMVQGYDFATVDDGSKVSGQWGARR